MELEQAADEIFQTIDARAVHASWVFFLDTFGITVADAWAIMCPTEDIPRAIRAANPKLPQGHTLQCSCSIRIWQRQGVTCRQEWTKSGPASSVAADPRVAG